MCDSQIKLFLPRVPSKFDRLKKVGSHLHSFLAISMVQATCFRVGLSSDPFIIRFTILELDFDHLNDI